MYTGQKDCFDQKLEDENSCFVASALHGVLTQMLSVVAAHTVTFLLRTGAETLAALAASGRYHEVLAVYRAVAVSA